MRNKRFRSHFCQQLATSGSSPVVSKEAALPPVGPRCPRDSNLCLLTAGTSVTLAPWRHRASLRAWEGGARTPQHPGLAPVHAIIAAAQPWVTSPFYPGSSLSLREAGTQPALVQQAASLGTFPVVTAQTLQGLPGPNHSRKRSPPPSDIDNHSSSRQHRVQEPI